MELLRLFHDLCTKTTARGFLSDGLDFVVTLATAEGVRAYLGFSQGQKQAKSFE